MTHIDQTGQDGQGAEPVESYWQLAREWWRAKVLPHTLGCPCLPCADLRAVLGRPRPPIRIGKHTIRALPVETRP